MMAANSKRAAEILNQIMYATIATVDDNEQPWNSPVYTAFDDELNFYWFSDKNSQHSKNIAENPNIFIVIYDSTMPEGTGEGVYIQAEAMQLDNEEEALRALQIMDNRVGKARDRKFSYFSGDAPLRVFRATPKRIWQNGDETDEQGNYIRDIRIEVPIEDLRREMHD